MRILATSSPKTLALIQMIESRRIRTFALNDTLVSPSSYLTFPLPLKISKSSTLASKRFKRWFFDFSRTLDEVPMREALQPNSPEHIMAKLMAKRSNLFIGLRPIFLRRFFYPTILIPGPFPLLASNISRPCQEDPIYNRCLQLLLRYKRNYCPRASKTHQ